MVFATRLMSCRTEFSRSLVPGLPWKYLLVTMLVAVCDQPLGTSTPSWRKIVVPFSFPISAVRFSHSTMSNAEVLPSVKRRSNTNPLRTPASSARVPVSTALPFSAGFTVAIRPSASWVLSTQRRPFYFTTTAGALLGLDRLVRTVRGDTFISECTLLTNRNPEADFLIQNAKSWPQAPRPGGASRQPLDSASWHRKRGVLFDFGAWQTRGF